MIFAKPPFLTDETTFGGAKTVPTMGFVFPMLFWSNFVGRSNFLLKKRVSFCSTSICASVFFFFFQFSRPAPLLDHFCIMDKYLSAYTKMTPQKRDRSPESEQGQEPEQSAAAIMGMGAAAPIEKYGQKQPEMVPK